MTSPLRVTGMVSGLDVDSIVKQMMQAKKIPIDQMKQKETQMEWKRDAYRDMNTLLSQLHDATLQMKLQSSLSAKAASSSNDLIASATGTGTAVNGNYTLKVDALATAASLTSPTTLGLDSTGALNNASASTLTVTGAKGSKAITINANTNISQVVSDINAQSSVTGVRASYDKVADKFYLTSSDTGANSFISVNESSGGSFLSAVKLDTMSMSTDTLVGTGAKSFTSTSAVINSNLVGSEKVTVSGFGASVDLNITNTTTIADLQDQLSRSALGPALTLSLDANGKLRFEGPQGGSLSVSGTGLTDVGLDTTSTSTATTVIKQGTDAQVEFNGSTDIIKYHTNNFTLNGIQFAAKATGTVSVNISTDTDAIYNKIKGFIDTYNDTLGKITAKYSEVYDRSYLPLTDDQRTSMSADQITQWETKAKTGLLNNDGILSEAIDSMREAMYMPVTSLNGTPVNTLAAIGISSYSYQDQGKLTIDETKLRQAISDNPDAVMQLFTNSGTGSDQGIAGKLYDTLTNSMNELKTRAGSSLSLSDQSEMGKQITDMKKQISDASDKLDAYEQNYYNMFAKLEAAMSQSQSQSQWLANQVGSGGGN